MYNIITMAENKEMTLGDLVKETPKSEKNTNITNFKIENLQKEGDNAAFTFNKKKYLIPLTELKGKKPSELAAKMNADITKYEKYCVKDAKIAKKSEDIKKDERLNKDKKDNKKSDEAIKADKSNQVQTQLSPEDAKKKKRKLLIGLGCGLGAAALVAAIVIPCALCVSCKKNDVIPPLPTGDLELSFSGWPTTSSLKVGETISVSITARKDGNVVMLEDGNLKCYPDDGSVTCAYNETSEAIEITGKKACNPLTLQLDVTSRLGDKGYAQAELNVYGDSPTPGPTPTPSEVGSVEINNTSTKEFYVNFDDNGTKSQGTIITTVKDKDGKILSDKTVNYIVDRDIPNWINSITVSKNGEVIIVPKTNASKDIQTWETGVYAECGGVYSNSWVVNVIYIPTLEQNGCILHIGSGQEYSDYKIVRFRETMTQEDLDNLCSDRRYKYIKIYNNDTQTFEKYNKNQFYSVAICKIDDSITEIKAHFLDSFSSMEEFYMTNSSKITKIGDSFLEYCSGLQSLDLSPLSGITSVGGGFLYCCSGLQSLDLSPLSGITSIGSSCLTYCSNLTEVAMWDQDPATVAYFGGLSESFKPFYHTSKLNSIKVPSAYVNYYNTTDPWSANKAGKYVAK